MLSQAYKEDFPAIGKPVDLTPHFHTYVNGREVAVPYRVRYFTEENGERGAELSEAPKDPGTYRAFAELVLDEDGQKYALPLARYETGFKIRVCNCTSK